jgi:hypothetical protein
MTNIRNWINLVENIDKEREFYINQANYYRTEERDKWWPVSPELMASYRDGDKPARILPDGSLIWEKNGLWHRDDDKPARIWPDDSLEWWKNGELHRDGDKPAIIYADNKLVWYKNGLRHRDGDKPAMIYADGLLEWVKNSEGHRLVGPAVIDENNNFEWWFKGEEIPVNSQEEYLKWLSDKGHIDVYRLRKQ